MADRIEIRMLGRLYVRRANGEVVEGDEWTTGKTADLLRILALNANRPVSVSGLVDKLWPDVDEAKGRASLRTAASRVRRVLGSPCIERHLGGLVLRNAWVDVSSFRTIVLEAKSAMHAKDYAAVVSLAREAEALYVADFHAHDDKSIWSSETRESLRMSRQLLLADAGDSAVQLLWMRDAIDFATLALASDPSFERPHRTLMTAHAGLGEIELALRAFDHCRVNLSQELGADPSPQTRALHIQILSGDFDDFETPPFTGREDEVESLAGIVRDSIAGDGCDVIILSGAHGSGRKALLHAASERVPHSHVRQVSDDGLGSSTKVKLASVTSDRRSDIIIWGSGAADLDQEVGEVTDYLGGLDPARPKVFAVITSEEAGDAITNRLQGGSLTVRHLKTKKMNDEDLSKLATTILSSSVTSRLMSELRDRSLGLSGRAVEVLREWIASGWIISTASGLDLYNDSAAVSGLSPVGDQFRILLEQVSSDEMEFCQLIAVIDKPVKAKDLISIDGFDIGHPDTLEILQERLDALSDLGIFRVSATGYEFRSRPLRDSFEAWLRPAVKARLMRQIDGTFSDHESSAIG